MILPEVIVPLVKIFFRAFLLGERQLIPVKYAGENLPISKQGIFVPKALYQRAPRS